MYHAHICTFLSAGILFDGSFPLWVSLKNISSTIEMIKGTLMQIWKSPYMFVFI